YKYMEEQLRFDYVEPSRSPTYEKVLKNQLEDAEAILGVNASPQKISELAESMYEHDHLFETDGL
ncbi:MAG TPA: hypothetical protein VJY84_02685, partial [Candidatus Saccharimonadales bacterium]|nr:hypothetical protein [Candidatus Saccharimonadales bacterium]